MCRRVNATTTKKKQKIKLSATPTEISATTNVMNSHATNNNNELIEKNQHEQPSNHPTNIQSTRCGVLYALTVCAI